MVEDEEFVIDDKCDVSMRYLENKKIRDGLSSYFYHTGELVRNDRVSLHSSVFFFFIVIFFICLLIVRTLTLFVFYLLFVCCLFVVCLLFFVFGVALFDEKVEERRYCQD